MASGSSASSSGSGSGPGPEEVSFEIGASFNPAPTTLTGLSGAEQQAHAWLRAYAPQIAAAERQFRVDRRAIAGAIAWEMLENVSKFSVRAVGPGKVHAFNFSKKGAVVGALTGGPLGAIGGAVDTDTAAKQAEDRGYLPRQTDADRRALLARADAAIQYIAAIMSATAEIAARKGFEDIRENPVILTNVYQGKTLDDWEKYLGTKKPSTTGSSFSGGNPMDVWVASHMTFLEDAVGKPILPECEPFPVVPAVSSTPPVPGNSGQDKVRHVVAGDTLSKIAKAEYGNEHLWPLIHDHNLAKVGHNPNLIRPGLPLSIPPLSRFSKQEIESAKGKSPTWRQYR